MIDQPSARVRLAAELAVGLARRLWMTLHYYATDAGFCWHMFQSTFVEGCYVLWELGVALAGADQSDDQGMTRQQCVAYAKQHPGDERFDLDRQSLFKFFPAPENIRKRVYPSRIRDRASPGQKCCCMLSKQPRRRSRETAIGKHLASLRDKAGLQAERACPEAGMESRGAFAKRKRRAATHGRRAD